MDYAALRSELQTDPAGLGYAGKQPGQIEALINAPTIAADVAASKKDMRQVLLASGGLALVRLIAGGTSPSALGLSVPTQYGNVLLPVCVTVDMTLADSPDAVTVDMADASVRAAVQQAVGVLEACGVITAATGNAILALGRGTISRAQQLGLGFVSYQDVQKALSA